MSKRRKGEQQVPRHVREFTPEMAVARTIREGDAWFYAWNAQETTGGDRLRKRTGIPAGRLKEIASGGPITRAELEALAKAWWITPEGLLASMPDPERVVG
jgi:hypothetical protein